MSAADTISTFDVLDGRDGDALDDNTALLEEAGLSHGDATIEARRFQRAQTTANPKKRKKFARPVKASAVQSRPVEWLWRGFVPLGALTMLNGQEGHGKSTLMYRVIAKVTTGGFGDPPADVALFANEDAIAEVVKPRLIAAGADLDRVHIYGVKLDENGKLEDDDSMLILPNDLLDFKEQVEDLMENLRLVVLDPIVDSLADGLEENSNRDVRSALQPLQKWAESAGVAVLGIGHLNKTHKTAANKSMGSKAWRATPRMQLLYGPNPDDIDNDNRRVLVTSKYNYTACHAVEVDVSLVEVEFDSGARETVVTATLGDSADFTDQDVAAAISGEMVSGHKTKREEAEELILNLLDSTGGKVKVAIINQMADGKGISRRTVNDAKRSLGVRQHPDAPDHWTWPDDAE